MPSAYIVNMQLSFTFTTNRGVDELMQFVGSPTFDEGELADEDEQTIKLAVARFNLKVEQYGRAKELSRLQRAYTERGHLNLELGRREKHRNSLLPPAQIGDTFELWGRTYRILGINSLGSIDAEGVDDRRSFIQFTGAGYWHKGSWRRYQNGAAGEFEKYTGRKWGAGRIVVPKARSTAESAKPAYLIPEGATV